MFYKLTLILVLFGSEIVVFADLQTNKPNFRPLSQKHDQNKNKDLESLKDQVNEVEETLNELSENIHKNNKKLSELQKYLQNFSHRRLEFPKHCKEVQEKGQNVSGVYTIFPEFSPEPFLVYCDMETQDGGWTYLLNRFNGEQDFYLPWEDYENGFGNLAEEFWLGLERLYYLTGYEVNELLVELEDWDSKEVYAHYDEFSIGSEDEGYYLKLLGSYKGTAGDSLRYHAGMKFTTKDNDQDKYNGGNCAIYRGGGWWYKNCVECHLTGKYLKGNANSKNEYNIMYWDDFHGGKYGLKEARMMVRPRNKNSEISSYSVVSTTQNPSHSTNLEVELISNKLENLSQKVDKLEKTIEKIDLINLLRKTFDTELSDNNAKSIKNSVPRNCKEVQRTHNESGIYLIQPEIASKPFMVVCDMETQGGGWTYIMNRFDGSIDFYQGWKSYKEGFGNLGEEFWLGLEHLYELTGQEINEVLIELIDWDLKKVYAHFSFFGVGSEGEGYALKVLSGYSGTAGDSFSYHGGMKFSTKDQDQDEWKGNCAATYGGGWWYKACVENHLTGAYKKAIVSDSEEGKIMYWFEFRGTTYSLKEARMMVKPRDKRSSPFILIH